jgi:cytidyltransferase-like protein
MPPKVFVSGCYDLLHSGHIAFFQEAAEYGDLYVAIGSDKTVYDLKGQAPVNNEDERLFMVQSVKCVKDAFISQGSGMLDFQEEFRALQPDIFIINEEGNTPDKEKLCEDCGVQYIILRREPHSGLTARSSTDLRSLTQMPYRIDLAGGWLDQPYVSRHHPGSVITISIEPTLEFNDRSGMASSTRLAALDMWGPRIPAGDYEKLAKVLFCYDNPPGCEIISGSQDAIGLVFPGLAKAYYEGEYWPSKIERLQDELALQFVENALYLVTLGPRHAEFDVLSDTVFDRQKAKALADSTEACWEAIIARDIVGFGGSIRETFEAQISMFPNMLNSAVLQLIDRYKDVALGWKLSGAGGGGYLILVADKPIKNAVRILARREHD